MLSTVHSAAVYGVDAYPIEIEVNVGDGDFGKTVIVGLPDAAVKESEQRVSTALINSGFERPGGYTTINLAPADIRKEGPSFDLPIAMGLLASSNQLNKDRIKEFCVSGELALSGEIRKVRGILPIAVQAHKQGCRGILVPVENGEEAAVVKGLHVYPVRNLREAADFINGTFPIEPLEVELDKLFHEHGHYSADFSEVKGQEGAKRALEVAMAGGHNVLLVGPPGTGKSMLAKRVPSILPPLSLEEALETTKIHSISGRLDKHQALVGIRPFRAPHHTISDAGLLGGGTFPVPGEVSLAHHGVLFLDELPEFKRNVLEVLRQPLEDGHVTISRASTSLKFPCQFVLLAAMNPCPCGFFTDPDRECRCSPTQIERYRNKISGPLMDRIDLHVEVPAVKYKDLSSLEKGEGSVQIRERVLAARKIQENRYKNIPQVFTNANMRPKDLQIACRLDEASSQMLKAAMSQYQLSARAYDRILKVARTIADLDHSKTIEPQHLAESIQYRALDREG